MVGDVEGAGCETKVLAHDEAFWPSMVCKLRLQYMTLGIFL